MKLNKKTLALAWDMSNRLAASFARLSEMTAEELGYYTSKFGDCGTRIAAPIFAEIGLSAFVKLTNVKAKEEIERRKNLERESDAQSLCREIERQENGFHHSLHTV
jgi:hypothetical protein